MPTVVIPEYDHETIYPNAKRISSSQFLLYLENPQQFYIENVLGLRREATTPMLIGRIFHACYENRSIDPVPLLKELGCKPEFCHMIVDALARFPKANKPETALIAAFSGWEFRATVDDIYPNVHTIIENKTGGKPWTQDRANTDWQITFQAWCYWKKYGIMPRRITLNWVDTSSKTVKIKSFHTTRRIAKLREFDRIAQLVIEGIECENWTTQVIPNFKR